MQNNLSDTIQATVHTRLLSKAHRLFTGTQEGRIIEILQNARRAGATQVTITNQDGTVTVTDNGTGIQDFHELLNMGGSGWSEGDEHLSIEASEDPAGVGLFCLAPRKLIVTSLGKQAVIEDGGWHGEPVSINDDPAVEANPELGTILCFEDEPWTKLVVEPLAVFTGMRVTVDGALCESMPFVVDADTHDAGLGYRLQVVPRNRLTKWHHQAVRVGCFG